MHRIKVHHPERIAGTENGERTKTGLVNDMYMMCVYNPYSRGHNCSSVTKSVKCMAQPAA